MQGLAQKLDPVLIKKQVEAAKRPPRKPTELEKKYHVP